MTDPKDFLITAAELAAMPERSHRHQFNDNAVRLTRTIGEAVGLQRIGLHLVRLPPGRDSTQHHYHDADEEFSTSFPAAASPASASRASRSAPGTSWVFRRRHRRTRCTTRSTRICSTSWVASDMP
jgi:hypothetical protein